MSAMPQTRHNLYQKFFPQSPAFRWRQIETALFDPRMRGWQDVLVLPKHEREELEKSVPWMSLARDKMFESSRRDTYKAILALADGKSIETVLMQNRRGAWTICVSSQVGCAMRCGFCATGAMGLFRSLSEDEIADQYRFWQKFLMEHPKLNQRISNIVCMGMGEPLANYDAVKNVLRTWLSATDLGPTHITVSTVGVLPRLEQMLTDPDWPYVRVAVSLHSADPKTRKEIVPTSYDDFLPKLQEWAKRYLEKFGNRRHHLTFEYVMLAGVNDTPDQARKLARFVNGIGQVKVNLIPYNLTDNPYRRSADKDIAAFAHHLEANGIMTMIRKTMGDDIAAACGQLIVENKESGIKN